jgi:hypothetical protein
LDNVIRAIRVRDANGDELTLYEYEQAQPALVMMGLNRSPATRLALDTGEEAMRVDDDHFVLVASGERLIRSGTG